MEEASETVASAPSRPKAIVGIGASAGGLESLELLFDNMPPNSGMAFVVVQHLSPDFKSLMDELLGRHSSMPIALAEDGMTVAPNHVYLIPPRKEMTIRGSCLYLTDKDPKPAFSRPIDRFFVSLAEDAREKAVAVVLSGSGSDGARGVQAIKKAGGTVIVETPATARFDGMPVSAIATGTVDHLCAPAEIPQAILAWNLKGRPRADTPVPAERGEPPIESVLRMLREAYGIDFGLYKTGTVHRRIHRRIGLRGSGNIEAYLEELETNDDELSRLYHDLLIGVTHFFRDPRAFLFLEQTVIPELVERTTATEELRVWVPGCATGEEAYSLALVLHEQLTAAGRPLNVKIIATDMHRASLEKASLGVYTDEQLIHVGPDRLQRYFVRRPGGYQVSQDLRNFILFAPHDVTKDAPFTKLNLISCRNLLIYFNPSTQKAVLSLFHFGLGSGGILFLGPSESAGALAAEFAAVDERWKVFRKKRDVRLFNEIRLPASPDRTIERELRHTGRRRPAEERQLLEIYDRLLDRYMPPSFLVDDEYTLIDSFSGAERFLQIKPRRPSQNILRMIEGELRSVVGSAVPKVLKGGEAVRYENVQLHGVDGRCSVVAEPVRSRHPQANHVLVSLLGLDDAKASKPAVRLLHGVETPPPGVEGSVAMQEHVAKLEDELAYTRETLQSTIEELETSNEELQAANEELIASNEELQSTNEELHSVNEELYTVNAEHQRKIEELAELNRDMQHLLDGTDVGTLYLDHELRIRKYTARIARIFRIQPQDVGRKIGDFSHNIQRPSLLAEIERVHRERVRVEEDVTDLAGVTYFLRILPYEIAPRGEGESPAAGVVLTLTDISALEHARSQLAELSAIVASSEDAILGVDLEARVTSWNAGAERLYGYSAEEALGRPLGRLLARDTAGERELELAVLAAKRGETTDQAPFERLRADGSIASVSIKISPIRDRHGEVVGASAIGRDVSALRIAQQQLQQREARIRLLLDSTAEALFGVDGAGVVTFCNPACARMLGFDTPEQLVGTAGGGILRFRGKVAWAEQLDHVLQRGKMLHLDGVDVLRADGSAFPAELWARPIRAERDVVGVVVTFLDATDRRRAQEEMMVAAKRRDHFLAMLSHELRNPLAAVLNAARVIAHFGTEAAGVPAEVRAARGVIERQAQHMARLLEDLLDVSRITRGKFTLRKQGFELGERIEIALESLLPMQAARDVRCNFVPAGVPLPMYGDPSRIQQVVANLVSNAIRYSDPGTQVDIHVTRQGNDAVIRVRDEGVGIDPAILPKVFELFVQAEQHLDRRDGGLGVGLTLVQHVTEAHGGRVEARSEGDGKGAEFTVHLPLDLSAHTEPLPPPTPRAEDSARRRIVVVEDQEDSREMLRMLLEARGHEVWDASDGPSGVEVIREVRPDVAFVDIGLPTMSGFEVAKAIRNHRLCDGITLIALSGYGAAADVQRARESGFDAHVTKPADLQRVDAILRGLAPRVEASRP